MCVRQGLLQVLETKNEQIKTINVIKEAQKYAEVIVQGSNTFLAVAINLNLKFQGNSSHSLELKTNRDNYKIGQGRVMVHSTSTHRKEAARPE